MVLGNWEVVLLACGIDFFMGDPEWLPHPIRLMGKWITRAESVFRQFPYSKVVNGLLFCISLVVLTWFCTYIVLYIAGALNPILEKAGEVILLYYCISITCLEGSAMKVYNYLKIQHIEKAKKSLACIVGRDVQPLSEAGVVCATVETVAENFVDGVCSPLFFYCIGGVPLAMAYKMVNTLDSMVGYKNEKYLEFGKASARMDDAANYIPARIAIHMIALAAQFLSKHGLMTLMCAYQEGHKHTSPNSGYPEAAFSGALHIRLSGPAFYQGEHVYKPYIGRDDYIPKPLHIKMACDMMILSSWLWIFCIWIGLLILQ
ncbi:MAG: cobalamin biosynthesis protein CobD [Desulfobacterales bacterium]|nr:cobalamin biosynthesis protein CobD [Desulfobacterales bacterium]